MKSGEAYKGFQVVPDITADDEMGCRAIARMSNPAFMDGVPAGLEPASLVADRTDWSAILEYEDEGRKSAAEASTRNLKDLIREALSLMAFDMQHRSTYKANWRRRALEAVGPMVEQVEHHAA
jgi:hypothetical protein